MSAAACETWIWGNKLQGSVEAVKGLLGSGEVDKTTKAGEAWLIEVNNVLGPSTEALDNLMNRLPTF